MLSACSNGPKKLTVSCLQIISTKELVKCIRLYNNIIINLLSLVVLLETSYMTSGRFSALSLKK